MHEAVVVEIIRREDGWEVRSDSLAAAALFTDIGLALDAATALGEDRPVQVRVRESAAPSATRNLMGNVA